jgi:hypothetical protein
MSGKDLYRVYGSVTDFKNYQGLPMPEWDALPAKIVEAWNAVADATRPTSFVDERELAQIAHARAYAQLYASAGIPGHGQFLLIAKLAEALGL